MKSNNSMLIIAAGFLGLVLVVVLFLPIAERDATTATRVSEESPIITEPFLTGISTRTPRTRNYEARGARVANSNHGAFVSSLDRSPEEKIEILKAFADISAHNMELRDQWREGLISRDDYAAAILSTSVEIAKVLTPDELEIYEGIRKARVQAANDAYPEQQRERNRQKISGLTEENQQRFMAEHAKIVGVNVFRQLHWKVDDLRQIRAILEKEFEPDQLYILDTLIRAEN